MDSEGFKVFLQSQGAEPNTINNYLRGTRNLDRDLKRLTGKGLDGCGTDDLQQCFADYHQRLKESSVNFYIMSARKYLLQFRGLMEFEEALKAKKRSKRKFPRFLREDEVKELIQSASNLRDKLILELLWETGCRPGELLNLRIRDVGFDDHSAIINLSGKTGDRLARVFIGKSDLIEYLNHHPRRGDPEARFITTNDQWHRPLSDRTLRNMVDKLGRRILNKPLNPYQFRHGSFTERSKFYTDRELKILGGWRTTNMLETYSHLNQRDVDEKTLQLHGLKPPKDRLSSLIEVKKCPGCSEDNAPYALYCRKCNRPLMEGVNIDSLLKSKDDLVKLARALKEYGFAVSKE